MHRTAVTLPWLIGLLAAAPGARAHPGAYAAVLTPGECHFSAG
jgi:hypothetical protein